MLVNKHEFYPTIQPRSSSERDNSSLLVSVLSSLDNTNHIKKRLLSYAALDKLDCEASCILIALSNHSATTTTTKDKLTHQSKPPPPQPSRQNHHVQRKKPNDPMMLLMAAAEVVNNQERKKQKNTWKYPSKNSSTKPFHNIPPANNSFSRQYHSMKQNPKIKQNALHTYITYMIYNDLAQQQQTNNQMTGSAWKSTTEEKPIMTRPLTAFLWDATEKKQEFTLPPLKPFK